MTDDVAEQIAALRDEDWGVREDAAKALGDLRSPDSVSGLIEALEDTDRAVREAATAALMAIGEAAVSDLGMCLNGPNLSVQEAVAKVLSVIADERVATPLQSALLSTDWAVRMYATKALAKLKWVDATETLVLLLQDTVKAVRDEAVLALEAIGEPAVAPLLNTLHHKEWMIRLRAAEALGKLGAPQAVGPLVDRLLQDPDTAVRQDAAKALGEIGHVGAVDALLAVLDVPTLQAPAIEALGKIGDPKASKSLVKMIKSLRTEDYEDRTPACEDNQYKMELPAIEAAVTALARIKAPHTLPVLVSALQSTLIRQEAAHALVIFGPQAIPPLIDVLKTEHDTNILFYAKEALTGLGWRPGQIRL